MKSLVYWRPIDTQEELRNRIMEDAATIRNNPDAIRRHAMRYIIVLNAAFNKTAVTSKTYVKCFNIKHNLYSLYLTNDICLYKLF